MSSSVHNKYRDRRTTKQYVKLFSMYDHFSIDELEEKYKWELHKLKQEYSDLIFDHYIEMEYEVYEWENGGEHCLALAIKRYETDEEHEQRIESEIERQAAIDNKEYEQYLKLKKYTFGALKTNLMELKNEIY